LQLPLGIAQVLLGLLLIVGLFRSFVYPIQALVLVGGALATGKYLLDPLGLYHLTEETRQVLFFPSSTVAVASLITLAFKSDDTLILDRLLFDRRI
jgi:putative oxidoreductase